MVKTKYNKVIIKFLRSFIFFSRKWVKTLNPETVITIIKIVEISKLREYDGNLISGIKKYAVATLFAFSNTDSVHKYQVKRNK